MECPVDKMVLETHTIHSVNVEECPQCRGLWFEEEELRKAKDEAKPVVNWLDFDLWSNQEALAAEWSSRKCPQCGKNMAMISYATTGITVDYCVEGHGVWLEKGEFESIVDALHQETLTKKLPEYMTASLEAAREIITGDEGFISEWKDFLTVTRLLQDRLLIENPKLEALFFALYSSTPFH